MTVSQRSKTAPGTGASTDGATRGNPPFAPDAAGMQQYLDAWTNAWKSALNAAQQTGGVAQQAPFAGLAANWWPPAGNGAPANPFAAGNPFAASNPFAAGNPFGAGNPFAAGSPFGVANPFGGASPFEGFKLPTASIEPTRLQHLQAEYS